MFSGHNSVRGSLSALNARRNSLECQRMKRQILRHATKQSYALRGISKVKASKIIVHLKDIPIDVFRQPIHKRYLEDLD